MEDLTSKREWETRKDKSPDSFTLRKDCSSKLLKECNEAKFALLEKGPTVLNLKRMEEKLENIQNKQISH
jgi:hypothetical protein